MVFIRSLLFNIAFQSLMVVSCVSLWWVCYMPRPWMMATIEGFLRVVAWMERWIAGIDYEVLGTEHLPASGSYIVAAKHQSAWETLKLHLLLHDPGVVLKRELTQVPVWGTLARKARLIPVDRGARGRAIISLLQGAAAIKEEGRPILIFPQGTRVAPGVRAPYKVGVALMYDKVGLPVIPMALNSGVFWPRRSFFKRPGTITVEFLPPIPPGLPRDEFARRLEAELEAASDRLVRAAGGPPLGSVEAPDDVDSQGDDEPRTQRA